MPLYIEKSRDLDRCYRCLTDSQRKDRVTQLLIKYKSGALVTQKHFVTRKLDIHIYMITVADDITFTTLLLLFLNQVLDTAHRWWFDRCGSGREAPGTSGGKCLAG